MNAFNLNIREYKRNLDGSIDSITLENGQQFESDVGEIEKNKTVTITENGTVTIKPSAGKDAMKKVTATVNVNTSYTLYAWHVTDTNEYDYGYRYFKTLNTAPETKPNGQVYVVPTTERKIEKATFNTTTTYTKVSDTEFHDGLTYYIRDSTKDITIW